MTEMNRSRRVAPGFVFSFQFGHLLKIGAATPDVAPANSLPALVTKAASKQTYYTIRFLADRERVMDSYRAYAYFRWVDDRIDTQTWEQSELASFVRRQQALIESGYLSDRPGNLAAQETMLLDLIRSDPEPHGDSRSYLHNMMSVMAFDAERRGRLISQEELAEYTRHLATGVTDLLYHCIGHDDVVPHDQRCYMAVTAAHITHMLRDTCEDIAAGYFNIPREFLESRGIGPCDVESDAYHEWVRSRVQLARAYFESGKRCITASRNLRRRLAGYAYVARFESVLDIIEREGYRLRPDYSDLKTSRAGLRMGKSIAADMLGL
jgi:phytoene/squalene synthetase